MKLSKLAAYIFCFIIISACSHEPKTPQVKLAINPWPGYEFLYLASELGYFEDEGLDVELIESPSLAEVQRLYSLGRANAMATTMIEAISAAGGQQKPTSIVLIPDYSNGGDVILAHHDITNIQQLKGKKVGAEIGSLGIFLLAKALQKHNLDLTDVEVINTEQLDALDTFNSGMIDAVVTYPPYSTNLLKTKELHQIFSSKEIPKVIIDTVSIDSNILKQDPNWQKKLHHVWRKTLSFAQENSTEAYQIMAQREGITAAEFEIALNDLQLLNAEQQYDVLSSQQLKDNIFTACKTLKQSNAISFNCESLFQYLKLVY